MKRMLHTFNIKVEVCTVQSYLLCATRNGTLLYRDDSLRFSRKNCRCFSDFCKIRNAPLRHPRHNTMPKDMSQKDVARNGRRHNPLEHDITATGLLKNKSSKRKSRHEDDSGDKFIDSKQSRKILKIGQELADEDEQESRTAAPNAAFNFESRFPADEEEADAFPEDDDEWGDEDEIEEIELDPEDRETFGKFFPARAGNDPVQILQDSWGGAEDEAGMDQGTDLTALILEKIAQHEATQAGRGGPQSQTGPVDDDFEMHPKVVEVYTK